MHFPSHITIPPPPHYLTTPTPHQFTISPSTTSSLQLTPLPLYYFTSSPTHHHNFSTMTRFHIHSAYYLVIL
ncbi:hypothetical protein E2C01_093730 [Portunus trituberculatus]|uniref:Uncharacterized protein n=1 Tax=Portunus trituberculatus TaxID=210409 RepID=A0A5B7JQK5_PORTR|nr:hypothetical protein [Portunus trituberculatus]